MSALEESLALIESSTRLALELVQTRRAWTVQLLSQRAGWSLNDWLERVDECPAAVRMLVGTYVTLPLGKCEQCGQRAPLAQRGQLQRCAWGCEPVLSAQPLDDQEVRDLTLWETDGELPAFRAGWMYYRQLGQLPPDYYDPTDPTPGHTSKTGTWGQNERVAFGRGALACKAVRDALGPPVTPQAAPVCDRIDMP